MKLHELKPNPGATHAKKRVGRGIGSGHGVTATRGTKGQKARSGGSIPAWFEGGQTPLQRRLPTKRGFFNPFRVEYFGVNLTTLSEVAGTAQAGEITPALLTAQGVLRDENEPFKILGYGDLSQALTVRAPQFSASARQKIEAAGGRVITIDNDGNEVTETEPGKPTRREARKQAGLEAWRNAKRLSTRAQMRAEGKEIVKGQQKAEKQARPAARPAKPAAPAGGKKK